ncbi:MAG TPA: hypothetical protein VM075_06635 [Anaerolineae bacterium]|nr:hypothetical protein [Anaerolineae bacterium]
MRHDRLLKMGMTVVALRDKTTTYRQQVAGGADRQLVAERNLAMLIHLH